MPAAAIILYGRGGSLGDFSVFARECGQQVRSRHPDAKVLIKSVERKDAFFAYLAAPPLAPGDKVLC